MILPDKYIKISESYIGVSSIILQVIGKECMTIDYLWPKFIERMKSEKYKNLLMPSYQKFALVINYMYIAGMINYNNLGEVYNENIIA